MRLVNKRPINIYLAIAAFLGATAVLAGAFGAHALKAVFSEAQLEVWKTASQYQLLHAAVLLAIALSPAQKMKMIRIACGLLTAGTLLFSGSLYLLMLSGVTAFAFITPVGGVLLISAWLTLLIAAFQFEYKH